MALQYLHRPIGLAVEVRPIGLAVEVEMQHTYRDGSKSS